MFGSENVHVATLVIDSDPGADAEIFYLMKAPRALTVKAAYAVAEQTQNAGTAILVRLENWGQNGTAVEGTITAYLGGTASGSRLTARTPAAATVDTAQDNVDSGDWLVARYGEEGSGWITSDRLQFIVQFVNGLGA
jgi:hypothetical protein